MSDDAHGIRMVDVGEKPLTRRTARASALISARRETIALVRSGGLAKGDAIATARIAGIMAAKRTSDVIPLCHPLPLDSVSIRVSFPDEGTVEVEAAVRTTGRTGVEMEALVAASAAALSIYDMCKSIDPGMEVSRVRLEEKTGGANGHYVRGG